MVLSRQTAASDGRACNGAGRPKTTGQALNHGRRRRSKHCAAAIRAGSGAHDGRRRPSGWRRSLLRRPTSGARATAIGRCGPFPRWAGIWKRFHMFATDDPGTGALARTVVGTHSRGHLDRFPIDFLIAWPARIRPRCKASLVEKRPPAASVQRRAGAQRSSSRARRRRRCPTAQASFKNALNCGAKIVSP